MLNSGAWWYMKKMIRLEGDVFVGWVQCFDTVGWHLHTKSVEPPRSTRSSSLVTVGRPPTSSSLRITDRCFRYASPCLWNQLPSSLRQPHSSPSVSVLPVHAPTTSYHSVNSPLSPSITPSLFHSRLKTYLFHKSFPP